jgi:hypothetical protein
MSRGTIKQLWRNPRKQGNEKGSCASIESRLAWYCICSFQFVGWSKPYTYSNLTFIFFSFHQHFFFGRNLAKFQPEKYDFDLYKGFSMEKMTEIHQISKTKVSRLADFYDRFQLVAKNVEGFGFFLTLISSL